MIVTIGLIVLLIMLFIRVPLFLAMIIVGTVGFALLGKPEDVSVFDMDWTPALSMLSKRFVEASQSYGFSIIPLFIYMGYIISRSGVSDDLYKTCYAFLGHRKGGLALATIVSCGGFAAMCGSSFATVATMSKVSMPPMKQRGYSDQLSSACVVAGGTLGILIPPSIALIFYGIFTETSIRDLFAAGLLPGILSVIMYLGVVKYVVWRDPLAGPAGDYTPWRERLKSLKGVGPVLILFTLVLGGIYLGVFTPTEAAGIGAGGATLITMARGQFHLKMFKEVLIQTVTITAVLFSILIGAMVFNSFANRGGVADFILEFVQSLNMTPMEIIFVMMVIYLFMGMIFDSLSMILLTLPIFFPIVVDLGLDPVWFGILMVVVIEISLVTPPIGMNVFVLSSLMPQIKIVDIFKGVTPFWISDIVRLLLLILFPSISLFLPNVLYH